MKITAYATYWVGEGDFEHTDASCGSMWEFLSVNVPLNSRPHSVPGNTVIFYDPSTQLEVARCQHAALAGATPHVVFIGGRWWQIAHGHVTQRSGRWCVLWHLCGDTKLAREANNGHEAERRLAFARQN